MLERGRRGGCSILDANAIGVVLDGFGPVRALAAAQRALAAEPHPAYGAPFVVVLRPGHPTAS